MVRLCRQRMPHLGTIFQLWTKSVFGGILKDYISALEHYREAIQYIDALGDPFKAAFHRLNPAFILYDAKILPEAKEFAQYALKKFRECGKFAADDAQKAQNLLELIEKDIMSA